MGAYILRRLALDHPDLLGIMLLSFTIVQFAPGGPVEQIIAEMTGQDSGDRLDGGGNESTFGHAAAPTSRAVIAAPRASIRNSSRSSKSSSASTSRPMNASAK
ncbi:MAG: hypothetical protein QM811_03230 [Pirellulales bacterium]